MKLKKFKPKPINGGKQIKMPKAMQVDLNKMVATQQYKNAMLNSFRANFKMIEKAGMVELRKSFLETGKSCQYITAEEYADLAVKTFEEVKRMR